MSKEFSFPNSGTCSKQTNFVLNDDHTIASMEVIGGCNGNLKGICRLVKGHEGRRCDRPHGGYALRFPQYQLPGSDRQEPEKGSGRNGLKNQTAKGRCLLVSPFVFPSRQKEMFFSVLRGYTSCENEFHQQGAGK